MDQGGAINPAMDDDDFMPAAMESDIYAPKQQMPPPRPPPQPTGCWGTFTRGVRCKSAFICIYLLINFLSFICFRNLLSFFFS